MTEPTAPLCFLDTETTSLNRRTRQAWDIGLIRREPDGSEEESAFFVKDLDLREADPTSLRIGRFYDRYRMDHEVKDGLDRYLYLAPIGAARAVERMTRGAVLVGAVPSFDEETLARLLYDNGLVPAWNYHLVDVETLAAGALRMPPKWDFDKVLAAYGLTYDEADRHTAIGDARMAMWLFDAVMTGGTS